MFSLKRMIVVVCVCIFSSVGALAQDKSSDLEEIWKLVRQNDELFGHVKITLDELLDANVKAMGGAEAIARIHTLQTKARLRTQVDGVLVDHGSIAEYEKSPNKFKTVSVTLKGRRVVSFDGKTTWEVNPREGLVELDEEESRFSNSDLTMLMLLHLQKTVPNMILVGSAKIHNRMVYVAHASLLPLNNNPEDDSDLDSNVLFNLFFDADTKLLSAFCYAASIRLESNAVVKELSDYRLVSGVKLPFRETIETLHNTQVDLVRTRTETNQPIADSFFLLDSETAATKSILNSHPYRAGKPGNQCATPAHEHFEECRVVSEINRILSPDSTGTPGDIHSPHIGRCAKVIDVRAARILGDWDLNCPLLC